MQLLSAKNIENKILENWIDYQYLFLEFQSNFLSGLYSKYQSVENGNLVLYFEKQTHQNILRKKDYDLNFNISYDKFWKNHHEINPERRSLIKISEDTFLPKETVRRKVLELVQQKVINKKNRNIGLLPNEQYKQSYNLFTDIEINGVCKLISYICKKMNISIFREEITDEIKKRFSFYWFHYLETQLDYLRLWSKQINDLELCLIFLQVAYLFTSKAKEKNISHNDIYDELSLFKEFKSASISIASVSEVTGIPRATCLRKLEILIKMKIVSRDKISRRYYIIPSAVSNNLISQKITGKVISRFSVFFFICLRAMSTKISN